MSVWKEKNEWAVAAFKRSRSSSKRISFSLFFFWRGGGLKRAVLWCYVELVEETGFLS